MTHETEGTDNSEDATEAQQPRNLEQVGEQELAQIWQAGDHLKGVFLDYDGTLREFEARPELAVPTQEIQQLLKTLDARRDVLTHIVSGRSAKFLAAHFAKHRRIRLIAEHERQVAGRFQVIPSASDGPTLHEADGWRPIRSEMERLVADIPGSHLEEKASSLVWHYRSVADEVTADAAAVSLAHRLEEVCEDISLENIRVSLGNKVVEVSCRSGKKGDVVRKICEEQAVKGEPFAAVLVAGDGSSDESMFEAAPEDSMTIKVGQEQTLARYRVAGPDQLRKILRQIAA